MEQIEPTSLDFDGIAKDALVDARGTTYRDFRRTLAPRWVSIWRDILAGHAVLAAVVLGLLWAQALSPVLQLLAACAGAAAIGYTVAYILLFFHEAAHYNIAKTRRANDVLANLLIGWLVGQDIKAYRPIHFDHHRHLGTPDDTERTYFQPLDLRFVVQALTGITVLKVLLGRERVTQQDPKHDGKSLLNAQLLLGLTMHGLLLGAAAVTGHWVLALAWLAGMGVVFPFFAAIRQLLEHRSFDAAAGVDYAQVAHGPVTRGFGDGPIASTLGGAGFNRHLLHHWDPQVSYTQLRALERFLLDTSAGPVYRAQQSTYLRAFTRLFAAGARRASSAEPPG